MEFLLRSLQKGMLIAVLVFAFLSSNSQTRPPAANTNRAVRVDTVQYANRAKELAGAVLVTGVIKDATNGNPLSGIRVTYQDFSAAITDSVGQFSLKVPDYSVAVAIEGEGYQAKEIALKGRSNISAILYEDSYASPYDVVNLPFKNIPQNKTPFAATSIQTRGNWARTAESPDAFLQGKVAGLNVIRRSGTPNIGGNLFLRGLSSLYTTQQPLVIVDGSIFDANDLGTSIIANNYTNAFAYIDVKDIENITVIKDGSSTYGTKGANGVINITTSRAQELATRIDFAVYSGINFAPKTLPVMDAGQYRVLLSDLLQSGGYTQRQVSALPYMNDDPNNPNYYRYHYQTDWQKRVFDNSALSNYYLKITGGDNIAKYALSLGYLTNAGITRETDLTRYNTRFNGDFNLSKRLTATANLSYTLNEQNLKDQGLSYKTNPIFAALIKAPFLAVNDVSSKGAESPTFADTDTFNVSNPVTLINNTIGINKNYRFFGSVGFNYSFSKSVSLNTIVGITVNKIRENYFVPRKGVVNDTLADGTVADSRLATQTKRILNIYNDTRLSYDRTFGHIHHFAARAGVRFQQSKTEEDLGFGANSATDELRSISNGVASLRRLSGNLGISRWLNTYVNADYSLSDKYFLSLNVAADGSSRFGKNVPDALQLSGNSYAILPSLAAAWLISSENFMANAKVFDLLKLRASVGLTGNDDIGDFNARQSYNSQNFLGMQGIVRNGFGNNQLQWESVRKLNLGLDAAILKERLNLTVDVYDNKTDKMLVLESLQTIAGTSYAMTNSGGMKTQGIEASVTGRVVNGSSFKWDLGVNVAHSRSKIDKLPTGDILTDYAGGTIISRVGNAPNAFFGYHTRGVYTTDAEASAEGLMVQSANGTTTAFRGGDMRFVDLNGDKIIDGRDRDIIGDPNPDFFGSVNTRFEYKRWSLEGMFTFTQGNSIYNYTRRQLESQSNYNNQTVAIVNRWKSEGQVTSVPRASFGDPMGNSRFSDRWIEDGSYFRLRTATVSYNIPIKTKFLRYSLAYLTANNLFTLTRYLGYDPEMSSTSSVLGQGVDITLEPQHRSVQLGIRFGL